MINARALTTLGMGYDALSLATIGFITNVVESVLGASDYRYRPKKRPKKKDIKKVIKEALPYYDKIPKRYIKAIDLNKLYELMINETMSIVNEYIKNAIYSKIQKEEEDDDYFILMML